MAMIPARSNGLRNFELLRWGIQRHMKCSNDGSLPHDDYVNLQQRGSSLVLESVRSSVVVPLQLTENNQPCPQLQKSPPKSAEKGGRKVIKEFKENIVRFKITEPLVSKDAVENEVENKEEKPEKVKPLILRKRKPLLPIRLNNEDQRKELRTAEKTVNKKRGRGVMAEAKKIAPLKISLSREEIEEDFMQILGHRPHWRPKKRPRNVQKALDNMFPGLHLNEVSVTADLYKVRG